jgi:hypothetical protein
MLQDPATRALWSAHQAAMARAHIIEEFVLRKPTPTGEAPMSDQLKPVIVRTQSAGAHFGYLKARDGKEVQLEKSRRLWRWFGAWTLSEIATSGLDVKKSKIGAPVSIVLTEAIEIIDCTAEAAGIIESATWAA